MARPKKEISEQNIEKFHKELEMAGNRSDLLLRDKRGRSRSCLLCKRRKQKCDHKLPSCTACLKASVMCIQPVRYNEETQSSPANPSHTGKPLVKVEPFGTKVPIIPINHSHNQNQNGGVIVSPTVKGTGSLTPAGSVATTSSTPSLASLNDFDSEMENGPGNGSMDSSNKYPFRPSSTSSTSSTNRIQKPKTMDKDQYTSFIERKLRYLEKMIELPPGGAMFQRKLGRYKKITHLLGDIDDLEKYVPNGPAQDHVQGITTPTTTIAAPRPERGHIPQLASDSLDSIDFNKCLFAKYFGKNYFPYDPAFEFDGPLAKSLLDVFFKRLQFKYPLLDEQEIYTFHEHFSKNNIYFYSTNEFHFASGRMWLVFAISAYMNKTTGKYKGLAPERYFSTAVRHVTKCSDNLNYVQKVEILTLLVLYLLRTDRDSSLLYDIMKDVMFICQKYLSLNKWFPQDPFARKKLRLFWCVYLLERMICVSVGKPFTISEADINLPLFDESSFNTQNSKVRGVHFINQSLKLRRLESAFVEKLNILPNTNSPTPPKQTDLPLVNDFFKQLEVWRSSCSISHVENFENETLKLYYYRSVRLLIQPYLEFLTPEDRLFRESQAAAGQICQLYKIFHQKTVSGHSTPAVHTVFVAGVNLVYCMWLARNYDDERRKKLGDMSKHTRPLISASLFSNMDDLRACSVCLYVMTERSQFARVFRDTFDQLMNATVGNLIERCGPDSSELIYLSVQDGNYSVHGNEYNVRKSSVDSAEADLGQDGSRTTSDEDKDPNGMPPARKRVFGKGQAEEHAGFVENSQVDIEEQKKLEAKQGDLAKQILPKGLTYLLTETNKDPPTSNLPSIITNTRGVPLDDNLLRSVKDIENSHQYMIKKPANSNECNWQMVQEQAFLQQQLAQQNLQVYLASLTNSSSNKGNANKGENPTFPQQFQPPMLSRHPQLSNNITNDLQATTSHKEIMTSLLSKSNSNISNVRNSGPIASSPSIMSDQLRSLRTNHGTQGTLSSAVASPLPPIGYPTIEGKPAESGVLFSNGTHDMINNISTWTGNSVFRDLSQRENYAIHQGLSYPNNIVTGDAIPQTPQQLSYHSYPPSPIPTGQNQSYQNQPLQPHQHFQQIQQQQHAHILQGQNMSAGIDNTQLPPSIMNNAANDYLHSGNVNQADTSNLVGSAPSTQIEDFWTINDDYGFLT
ncbi:uncharacterized protein KNAG_0F03040 [Huiozyma naganishii CBS 8797]|uniref:Zn(2)-C6 fungal-type domain-containing protein n=1 Tax=Huiozyma naganishii (strain ATCC MYA-139 / BCRC 22969 / CBS 8797 / KCTC 17520 / NBRC 10181 / NCYC 3082 / Yp74L-3) TaxID=1071383 RepID=J7S8M0_HUIN7|nr:hypothetical protein KNAG_0F03040 [Kazachstania naganishii CBS 8797]CCK70966.1 hypothetical protein KNAG_0F03040 [Kazachstania naganishii CBS 8797]